MLRLNALNWKILSGNFMLIYYLELIDLIWLSKTMKKKIGIVMVAVTLLAFGSLSANAIEVGAMTDMQPGPAPNSGDGIPDGSGMDNQFQNGDPGVESQGPAPNSGDGIPDGSGF